MSEITTQPMTVERYVDSTIEAINTKLALHKLTVPKGYAIVNGLHAAMLAIQQTVNKEKKPALSVVSDESVKQFLLNVVQDGLYLNKDHGYPIVYGNKLVLITSYMGEVYKAKQNDSRIKDIWAEVVYQEDVFRYSIEHGHKVISVHEQDPDSIDKGHVKGAYATILYHDGTEVSDYMTMDQIEKSWQYGQSKGTSEAHVLSKTEMIKKTVLRRVAKLVNATNNDALLTEMAEDAESFAASNANTETIDITPHADALPSEFKDVEVQDVEIDDPFAEG